MEGKQWQVLHLQSFWDNLSSDDSDPNDAPTGAAVSIPDDNNLSSDDTDPNYAPTSGAVTIPDDNNLSSDDTNPNDAPTGGAISIPDDNNLSSNDVNPGEPIDVISSGLFNTTRSEKSIESTPKVGAFKVSVNEIESDDSKSTNSERSHDCEVINNLLQPADTSEMTTKYFVSFFSVIVFFIESD